MRAVNLVAAALPAVSAAIRPQLGEMVLLFFYSRCL